MINVNDISIDEYLTNQESTKIQKELARNNHQHNLYRPISNKITIKYRCSKTRIISAKKDIFLYFISLLDIKIQSKYHDIHKLGQRSIWRAWISNNIRTTDEALDFLTTSILNISL